MAIFHVVTPVGCKNSSGRNRDFLSSAALLAFSAKNLLETSRNQ